MQLVKAAGMLFFALIPMVATGAVIHVPADQPTIQAGIDAASNGDTVLVADGIWTGEGNRDLDFGGKAITLRSENGPQVCEIKGEPFVYASRAFTFHSGEGSDSVVEGFTISSFFLDSFEDGVPAGIIS